MERCEKATLIYLDDGCMLLSKKIILHGKKYRMNMKSIKQICYL